MESEASPDLTLLYGPARQSPQQTLSHQEHQAERVAQGQPTEAELAEEENIVRTLLSRLVITQGVPTALQQTLSRTVPAAPCILS